MPVKLTWGSGWNPMFTMITKFSRMHRLPMVLRCFARGRVLLQIKLRTNLSCHTNSWVFADNNYEPFFRAAQKLMSSKEKHQKRHTEKQEASPHYPSSSVELIPSRYGQKEVQPYRPFALRGHVTPVFMKMKVIWFFLQKTISGSYVKQNNSDLVFQTRTIFLKRVRL